MKWNSWVLTGFVSAFILFNITTVSASSSAGKVIIRLDLKKAGMRIQDLPGSIDIAGQDLEHGTVDIVGSHDYFQLLQSDDYPVEILRTQPESIDSRYMNPQKIEVFVNELQRQYPDLVRVETIGQTLKGRPLRAVRISRPDGPAFKPAVLFNAMHHAREIMTPEVAVDIMIFLVKNAENPDMPLVAEWLKRLQIWVIPQVNPDGNEIVWNEDNWWRKNARGDGSRTWGVDINRNYPYAWNTCNGSSGSPGNQTYRGESPGSEPETQAVMKFVQEKNIALSVSYHSYSELVIAPYGCQGSYTPENAIVRDIGREFAGLLKTDDGRGTYKYGTGWELLYSTDGDDISWMYNKVNTLAYVVEINSSSQGFQPDYERWRNKTVEAQRPGWQYLLSRMIAGPQVVGRILDSKTGQPVNATVSIAGVRYKDENPRRSQGGYFQKLLIPGSYELVFSAPGYQTQRMAVSVDSAPAVQDVFMEPGLSLDESF